MDYLARLFLFFLFLFSSGSISFFLFFFLISSYFLLHSCPLCSSDFFFLSHSYFIFHFIFLICISFCFLHIRISPLSNLIVSPPCLLTIFNPFPTPSFHHSLSFPILSFLLIFLSYFLDFFLSLSIDDRLVSPQYGIRQPCTYVCTCCLIVGALSHYVVNVQISNVHF